jgi:two-component system, sensor histidine kinase YesM
MKLSVKRFLMINSVLLILLLSAAVSILHLGVSHITTEMTETFSSETLSKIAGDFSMRLRGLSRFAVQLGTDSDIVAVNEEDENLWVYKDILNQLQRYAALNETESRLTLYLGQKGKGLSSHDNLFPIDAAYLTREAEHLNIWYIRKGPSYEESSLRFFFVNNPDMLEQQVSILVEIDFTYLSQLLSGLNIKGGGTAFLVDPHGNELISGDYEKIREAVNEDLLFDIHDQEGIVYAKDKQIRLLYTELSGTGLILGMAFTDSMFMEPVQRANRFVLLLFSIAAVLIISQYPFLYLSIRTPLGTLRKGMLSVEQGDYSRELNSHWLLEIDYIYHQYNRMVRRIESLLNEVKLEHLRTQEAEYKFLQAQINPHFLYNSLNYIYQMSIAGDSENAAEMSIALSSYFKAASRANRPVVPLQAELENITVYMKIQELRHPDRVSYEVTVDDGALNTEVPRLLLQPFVENSLVHGMETADRSVHISISATIRDHDLELIVEDDGPGIPENKLNEMNLLLRDQPEKLTGCGIRNPCLRLRNRYGQSAGVRLVSRQPHGLTVILNFPETPLRSFRITEHAYHENIIDH